jgi:hypothetical protein
VSFYAADGSFIITPQIATGTDVNTGWTQLTGSTVAPAGAARVRLNVYVVAAAGAGEGHFVDDVSLSSDKVVITEILPMVPIQVQATWNSLTYNLFTGYATSWADAGLNIPGYAETTLTATDGLYVLAGVTLPTSSSPVGTGENACDRVARLLDFAGWPAGQRSIDECDTVIQGTTLGDTALNLINNTTQTEVGEFYIDGSGNAVFRRRNAILQDTRSTVPQMVLGDQPGNAETDGTELPYSVAISSSDDVNMFNDIQATSVGGTMQEAIDDASVSQYQFPRVYSNSELLYLDDGTTLAWAQYVLLVASQAIERFDTVTLMPRRDPGDLFPQVLGREVGDLIEVWRRPPNVAAFTRQCLIRSIDHTWDSDTQNWQTVWGLQLASNAGSGSIGGGGGGFSFLVLDDPVRGTLDQNSLSF